VADSKNSDDRTAEAGASQDQPQPVIVAIGASAGGLAALQILFAELPENTGAAFVVVVHLDPQYRSELPSILAMRTRMPVVQVGTRERLQANHVYVIPPDRRLQVVEHEVSALEFDEPHGQRSAIDGFFRSVAERLGDGIAVILSGAGSDGAIGVRAVKEAGGIILVQDPHEAEYSSMPRNAIATGAADFVLTVSEIAAQITSLMGIKRNLPAARLRNFEQSLHRVLAHLRVRTGHDFAKYKRPTILRRIARRMQVTKVEDLDEYYAMLRDNAAEAQALLDDLLISVTTFFRDSGAFEALARHAIPKLLKPNAADESVRVWVAGCATGEEAYSIAMLLLEEAAQHQIRPTIEVFASDLDPRALAAARAGRFPRAIEADVSEQRLRRFFTREGDHYRVRQEVRDIILFAAHDLLKDPPFSRVGLISCRNVLIYLDRELQEQLCRTFYYALNSGGFLLLGPSESADHPPGLFQHVDRSARLYQSSAIPGDKPRLLPRLLGSLRGSDYVLQPGRVLSPAAALNEAHVHRYAIERAAPPSILVDDLHRVINLSENAGRFVLPSGGPLSGDVADLLRPELRFEARSALNRVFQHQQSTLSPPILVRFDGELRRVLLQVKPAVENEAGVPSRAVIMFIEGGAAEESLLPAGGGSGDATVQRLNQELELAQTRLRTMSEESEATNEELRAANEELQSINEEYRSTSEELETSREELQSINEELQTVNSELKLKLEAVSQAHSDLQNVMEATDLGTLFLDSGLRIKRFTERVTDLFSITTGDEGRPITDFAHQLEYEDLVKDADAVLADLAPVRREVRSRGGRWYDMRVRPYRTVDDKIDGVVVTFVDVTERHLVGQTLEQSEQRLQQKQDLIDLSHDPIFVWDFDGGVVEWNRGSQELYGYSRDEAIGKQKEKLLATVVPNSSFAALKAKLLQDGSWAGELRHKTKDGRDLIVESRLQLEDFDGRRLVLESTRDVSAQRLADRRQRLLLAELTHRVRNTLAVIQAIARHTQRNTKSKEDFVERFEGRLASLASAHSLLVGTDWKGADFAELARQQLAPYISVNQDRLRLQGDPISLPADLATPFGLVLHELATNAAKHGALSVPSGTVTLNWTISPRNPERVLKVVWQESGGPNVDTPRSAGFGGALIDSVIPGAHVEREFRSDGFVCTIELPLREETETVNGPV
jgi:two-component system, chemotaxis family, CheB/CheR fusion protein